MRKKPILVALMALLMIAPGSYAVANTRKVQLLAFEGGPVSVGSPNSRNVRVAGAMLAEWSHRGHAEDVMPGPPPVVSRFVLVPMPFVPAWMRGGDQNLPAANILAQSRSVGCPTRQYRPSGIMPQSSEARRRLLYPLVQEAACASGLPLGLMDAMVIQESRYNPFALSPKGAFGLAQIMPATARQLGVDRYNLRSNLTGAARYLRAHLDRFGRVDLALGAYNAGPGHVSAARGLPNYSETRRYVSTILRNWQLLDSMSP